MLEFLVQQLERKGDTQSPQITVQAQGHTNTATTSYPTTSPQTHAESFKPHTHTHTQSPKYMVTQRDTHNPFMNPQSCVRLASYTKQQKHFTVITEKPLHTPRTQHRVITQSRGGVGRGY